MEERKKVEQRCDDSFGSTPTSSLVSTVAGRFQRQIGFTNEIVAVMYGIHEALVRETSARFAVTVRPERVSPHTTRRRNCQKKVNEMTKINADSRFCHSTIFSDHQNQRCQGESEKETHHNMCVSLAVNRTISGCSQSHQTPVQDFD